MQQRLKMHSFSNIPVLPQRYRDEQFYLTIKSFCVYYSSIGSTVDMHTLASQMTEVVLFANNYCVSGVL